MNAEIQLKKLEELLDMANQKFELAIGQKDL